MDQNINSGINSSDLQQLDEITVTATPDYFYVIMLVLGLMALIWFDSKKTSQHSKKRKRLISSVL